MLTIKGNLKKQTLKKQTVENYIHQLNNYAHGWEKEMSGDMLFLSTQASQPQSLSFKAYF